MTPTAASQASSTRLFIVEFDLHDQSSHFFNEALGLKLAAEQSGMAPVVFVHKGADALLARPLGALEIMPPIPDESVGPDDDLDVFADSDRRLRSLWDALDAMAISHNDIVFITSSRPVVIYSLGAWLGRLKPEQRPAVFFRFFWHGYLDLRTMGYGPRSWPYRFAARDLALRPGQDRVFFTTNTARVVPLLGRLCSRRIFEMPLTKYYGDIPDRTKKHSDPPTVYVQVSRRPGIMADQIAPILRTILDAHPGIHVLLKDKREALDSGNLQERADLIGRGIELLPAEQSPSDYLHAIARSDILILPYDPLEYQAMASGVFCEGAAFGKVIVCPAGTWMSDQIDEDHATGLTFNSADHSSVGAALSRALASLDELLPQARARSAAFRAHHSSARNIELMRALAADSHDMSLTYLLGGDIDFRQRESRGYLRDGWSQTEAAGVWSDGSVADLIFRIESAPTGPLTVRVRLTPCHGAQGTQTVAVCVNGVDLCDWNFPVPDEHYPAWRQVTIPCELAAGGNIDMRLRVANPVSPRELEVSDDRRLLGLLLEQMKIDKAAEQVR